MKSQLFTIAKNNLISRKKTTLFIGLSFTALIIFVLFSLLYMQYVTIQYEYGLNSSLAENYISVNGKKNIVDKAKEYLSNEDFGSNETISSRTLNLYNNDKFPDYKANNLNFRIDGIYLNHPQDDIVSSDFPYIDLYSFNCYYGKIFSNNAIKSFQYVYPNQQLLIYGDDKISGNEILISEKLLYYFGLPLDNGYVGKLLTLSYDNMQLGTYSIKGVYNQNIGGDLHSQNIIFSSQSDIYKLIDNYTENVNFYFDGYFDKNTIEKNLPADVKLLANFYIPMFQLTKIAMLDVQDKIVSKLLLIIGGILTLVLFANCALNMRYILKKKAPAYAGMAIQGLSFQKIFLIVLIEMLIVSTIALLIAIPIAIAAFNLTMMLFDNIMIAEVGLTFLNYFGVVSIIVALQYMSALILAIISFGFLKGSKIKSLLYADKH